MRALCVLALLVVGLLGGAYAHWADLAAAEIAVGESEVEVVLTFPTGLVGEMDTDRDGRLSAGEVGRNREALTRFFERNITLESAGERGRLEVAPAQAARPLANLSPGAKTHSTLRLTYRWGRPVEALRIEYGLFLPGVSTSSCVATILQGGEVQDVVFRPDHRVFRLGGGADAVPQTFQSFLKLGLEHILTGYDHLLFVLSLLMLGGGLAYLLKVVTAFTAAHSITLSLAALGLVSLPPRLVESGIALTIAYVAAENLFRKDLSALTRTRWALTFAFGLVHGLGFAGVLEEIGLPRQNLALSLLGFNLGVELGQLAVVLPAFLLLQALRRWRWEAGLRRAVSAGAVAAGLAWFVQRAFLGA